MNPISYINQEPKRIGVEKLNDGNYHSWKIKMKWMLTHDQLWEIVNQAPPTTLTADWQKRNCKALSLIGLHVEDRYQVDLDGLETAFDAWNSLAKLHLINNMGSRLLLYRKLVTVRYIPNTDMGQHLANILELSNRLTDIGHPVNQELLCSALLGSLPPEYGPLITSIEGRGEESITPKYVREKILEEYTRLTEAQGDISYPTKVLHTTRHPNQYQNQQGPICYYCRKVGHIRRDCRSLKQHEYHQGLAEDRSTRNFRNPTISPNTQSQMVSMYDEEAQLHEPQPKNQDPRSSPLATSLTELRVLSNHTLLSPSREVFWLIDSGACLNMTKHLSMLKDYQELTTPMRVTSAGGQDSWVIGKGRLKLNLLDEQNRSHPLWLSEVYLVPSLTDNLIAVSALEDSGFTITFQSGKAILTKDSITLTIAHREQGLYIHREPPVDTTYHAHVCEHTWHDRLGHRHYEGIQRVLKNTEKEHIKVEPCQALQFCRICNITKMKNRPFKERVGRFSKQPFELIHSNLCGPIQPISAGGNKYLLTLIDDFSRYLTTIPLKNKSEAAEKIKEFLEHGENIHGRRLTYFRSDGGGEFIGKNLEQFMKHKGVAHQMTIPNSPQSNGVAEKFNHILLDTTRALLKQSKLPAHMWAEMASTSTYLINRNIQKTSNLSPYQMWTGRPPRYEHLRVIGSPCYYYNNSPTRSKLEDRALPGILVGYGDTDGTFRIWSPELRKITLNRRVSFYPERCPHKDRLSELGDTPEYLEVTSEEDIITGQTIQGAALPDMPNMEKSLRTSARINKGMPGPRLTYDTLGEPTSDRPDGSLGHTNNNMGLG